MKPLLIGTLLAGPVLSQLAGTYSVGPGSSFPTLSTAIAALMTNGVAAPVTFSVTGNQVGPFTIGMFPGQGPTNPVRFVGTGASLSGPLPLVTLNGCAYVTFSGFTASPPAGEAIVLGGSCEQCVFSNCTILMPSTTTDTSASVFKFLVAHGCRVEDSHFGGGFKACNVLGGTGTTIQRCRVRGGGTLAFHVEGSTTTIANNFIYGNSSGVTVSWWPCRILNNSFSLTGGTRAIQLVSSGAEVVNNIIAFSPTLSPAFAMTAFFSNTIDYNVYHLSGTAIFATSGAPQYTFQQWQAQFSYDLHSVQANPQYLNPGANPPDLHIAPSSPCVAAGKTAWSVFEDVDWAPRGAPYDIGAHEVSAQNILSGITSGGGAGDLVLSLSTLSPLSTEGYTLLSATAAFPAGTGPQFGIEIDALTLAGINTPMTAGHPLHFPVGLSPYFPQSPFVVSPGQLSFLNGQTWDVVCVLVGQGFSWQGRSNVVRLQW